MLPSLFTKDSSFRWLLEIGFSLLLIYSVENAKETSTMRPTSLLQLCYKKTYMKCYSYYYYYYYDVL